QQIWNRLRDDGNLSARQPARARRRLDAGNGKNLVGVNVAEPGDDLLVEQQVADAPVRGACESKQIFAAERGIEGVDPDVAQLRQAGQIVFLRRKRQAEPAR